ncbi:anti-sigma factor [Pedobacter sp. KBW06]|uniref:FecR family protein n=1 Tax=Pedobacter sp. KBW06 TaxID=2153359 RepID=UPI000F5AA593|nr:FecR family protein [Pedobacter sp. KBW06]RQO71990.1 anti-sigma factor [Pedobacter sp. KBW06]
MNEIKDLLDRYFNGTCSEAEKQNVETWLETYNKEDNEWLAMNKAQQELWLNSLFTKIELDIDRPGHLKELPKRSPVHMGILLKIAATIILLLSIGFLFFKYQKAEPATASPENQEIIAGGNRAILTLANGQTIDLSHSKNGEIATQSGLTITKKMNGELIYEIAGQKETSENAGQAITYNTISTPRGGKYQINLPDGTQIWLNAASSVRFPASFRNLPNRRVELSGEAYFEVTKNANKPFIVVTKKQETQVLGTHFNINSYEDEGQTKTTLLEGSIRVSDKANRNIILKPGQQSTLKEGNIDIRNVDENDAIAWKKGLFSFNDENLESIMRKISRWYDVDIHYQDTFSKTSFLGTISLSKNITSVLKILEKSGEVHFKIEGRRITVMK